MAGFERNEWMAQQPEEVFTFIGDTANASQIIPSVQTLEKLTDGPMGVGTRLRETRIVNGKEAQAELEIVEYEPPQRYAVRNETMGVETIYRYQLTPEKGGTRVDLVCEVKANGLKKVVVPLVVTMLKKEDGDHLERLKRALQART